MRDLLYYGHQASNFGAKYGEDTDLFNAVLNYATRKDLVGLQVYRIQQQLTMELGRFSSYRDTTNYTSLLPAVAEMRRIHEGDIEGNWRIQRRTPKP